MKDTNYRIIVNLTADVIVGGLVCLFVWYILKSRTALTQPPDSPVQTTTAPEQRITFEDLLDAIRLVETGGELDPDNCRRDGGRALGAYQIHEIYVDDVNDINTFGPKYSYEDRRDRIKSRAMAKTYLCWYIRFTRGIWKKPEWDDRKWEFMARIHNGGANGWKKESTKPYWEKVRKYIEVEL